MNQETHKLIARIAEEHSNKTFGYLDKEDLKSEIWVICLEKLPEFDPEVGKLEHFLRVAVKNRLVNRYKDVTKSVRSPCPRCPYYDPENSPGGCSLYGEDKDKCTKWRNYQLSIDSRNSLLNTTDDHSEKSSGDKVVKHIIGKEMRQILDKEICEDYRRDFEEFMSGGKISKQRVKRLKREIVRILEDHGVEIGDI